MSEPQKIVIAIEEEDFGIGYVFAPGAIKLPQGTEVPVHWHDQKGRILGKAGNLRREGNKVLVDVVLDDHIVLDLEDGIGGTAFLSPAHVQTNNIGRKINKIVDDGQVRCVYLKDK